MNIEPALPRYRLGYGVDGLRVAIPARRDWPIAPAAMHYRVEIFALRLRRETGV